MKHRIDLLELVPDKGRFVEVGTLNGDFALEILRKRPDIDLIVVDSWKAPHENAEAIARKKLGGHATIYNTDSVSASQEYSAKTFDMVYLDADHTYNGVIADLEAWWPKVKPGGYLAGHDYEDKPLSHEWHTAIEVKRAVDEWAAKNGLTVNAIEEAAPSFYIRKP